jgi:putative transcriptional regulator
MSSSGTDDLTGSLLFAHPGLLDPNFRRTILFLPRHSLEDGAIGIILNRPIQKSLAELAEGDPASVLNGIPLFQGGPVAESHLTVVSLQWLQSSSTVAFRAFPPNPDGELEIDQDWTPGLRGFLGHAGWSQGQLESEIAESSWIIQPPTQERIEMSDPEGAWLDFMRSASPVLRLLAEAPDDPELN